MAQVLELEGGIRLDVSNTRNPQTLVQASQAASLKRIADSLANSHFGQGLVDQLALWRL